MWESGAILLYLGEKYGRLIPTDARRRIEALKWLFFEIAPLYGRSRVTGLARLSGYPVGVMANNPKHHGGATDVAAGNKVMRLIQLCNTFHLPLISFADEPDFMVWLESEKLGAALAAG